MKKIYFALLALVTLCACDETGSPSDIFDYDPGKLNQVFFADQTGSVATFHFAAAMSWDASVSFPSEAEVSGAEKWLTVTPDHGDGGAVTMSIVLNANETGKTRTAQINIACGSAVLPLLITQKAENNPGPQPTEGRWLVTKIVQTDNETGNGSRQVIETHITYDAQHRITKVDGYEGTSQIGGISFTYQPDKITEVWREGTDSETTVYTLDASGKVVSWESQGSDAGRVLTSEGRLEYDGNRLTAAFATSDGIESTDKIYWDADNMIKVAHYDNEETGTDFTYGKELNNPKVNLDLNYIVTDSEWLDCLAFDSFMVKAMGYIGARSTRMIAGEKDFGPNITGETVTYTYTTDNRGLITHVAVTEPASGYESYYEFTYTEVK